MKDYGKAAFRDLQWIDHMVALNFPKEIFILAGVVPGSFEANLLGYSV